MPRALIVGDSFVRRLQRNPVGLNLRRWHVQYRGLPGADIARLWTVIQQHVPRRYDTVVIHGGSNDLCRSDDVNAVVESLLDLAMYVSSRWTVQQVVISQVLLRRPNTRFPMPFTLAEYNSSVASVNETRYCQFLRSAQLIYIYIYIYIVCLSVLCRTMFCS